MVANGIDRRTFLKATGAGAAGLLLVPKTVARPSMLGGTGSVFRHGVASGDPLSNAVMIWTRVTRSGETSPGSGLGKPVEVKWQVATDPSFKHIVKRDDYVARAEKDHTVNIDARGLDPGKSYFYRFKALNEISPTGHMRTTHPAGVDPSNVRFGLASCANWEGGYFSAYRFLSEREDLDFVLHMGDYIYEYGAGTYGADGLADRVHRPDHEIVSLADYRIRHAQYKTDTDLQACHAAHSMVAAWDDHEVTNDTWREGAENHQEAEGKFIKRRNLAYRAYFEWMPLRRPQRQADPTRIYRRLHFGNLARLHMLDTRQYRDVQPSSQTDESRNDADRTITGPEQMKWLKRGLSKDAHQWDLIGNQLMITPWETGEEVPFNVDAWDGYTADRAELLGHIQSKEIDNVVFLTGDIHTSWANDVPIEDNTYPVTPSVAVEMVGPSITSDNADEITGSPYRTTSVLLETEVKADNPWVKYVELDSHGYSVVDVTKERLNVDWYFISNRTDPQATQGFAATWKAAAGDNAVSEGVGPV